MKVFARIAFALIVSAHTLMAQTAEGMYRREVYEKSLAAGSRLTVLSIGLQPGFEDITALAYLSFGRGAKIVNAFVTNGESGTSDKSVETPGALAFRRRAEAFRFSQRLRGSEYFLNFPDFGSARDSAWVAQFWQADSLTSALVGLIEAVRPDLILIAPDREESLSSARLNLVRQTTLNAVRTAALRTTESGFIRPNAWKVARVLVADRAGSLTFPVENRSLFSSGSYTEKALELASVYESMSKTIPQWLLERISYDADMPRSARLKTADGGLPTPVPASLRKLSSEMENLGTFVRSNVQSKKSPGSWKKPTLQRIVSIMDSVDRRLSGWSLFANEERKILLHWKEGLEELRNAVFGVSVDFAFRDTVLLSRQITVLRVDSVHGLPPGGGTEIFFPDVGPRWVLNEDTKQRLPLETRSNYRLISPTAVDLDLPASYGGQMKSTFGTKFDFFILHAKKARTESFFKKISQRFLFAPKFTLELLTPLVRVVPGEKVLYRLTNHSNDGIADAVGIDDSLALAPPRPFRLSVKESSVVDTLTMNWNEHLENGTYRIPLQIGSALLGYFGARKFDVSIDSSKRIGLVPAMPDGVVERSIRKLGMKAKVLGEVGLDLASLDVVVVDERVGSFKPTLVASERSFGDFAVNGGTIVILSQDSRSWNASPMLKELRLSATTSADVDLNVAVDGNDPLSHSPNELVKEDWEGWLFSRCVNLVNVQGGAEVGIPLSVGDDHIPGILVVPKGRGKIVYVNLNLAMQLENIHPTAFRLFANLLAY